MHARSAVEDECAMELPILNRHSAPVRVLYASNGARKTALLGAIWDSTPALGAPAELVSPPVRALNKRVVHVRVVR